MYTGIVEEIEGICLHVRGAVIGDHLHDLALGHASLQQSVIHGNGDTIFAAEGHVRRDLCFEGQMAHFMIGHQSVIHPLHVNHSYISQFKFEFYMYFEKITLALIIVSKYVACLSKYESFKSNLSFI